VIKRIGLLIVVALVATALLVPSTASFAAQDLPAGCTKVKGKVVCQTQDFPGASGDAQGQPQPGGTTTTTTTTQGNTTNFSPEPQGTGTQCSGPPGRCR
jgi:hypothetical protein